MATLCGHTMFLVQLDLRLGRKGNMFILVGGEDVLRRQHGRHNHHFPHTFEIDRPQDCSAQAWLKRNNRHRPPRPRNPAWPKPLRVEQNNRQVRA
eukprot:scaffold542426_cov16-Prasinocladus_malaysianus.AAC.1